MAVLQVDDVEREAVEELLHSYPPQPLQPRMASGEDILQRRERPLARRADTTQAAVQRFLRVGQRAVAEQREAIQLAPRVRDEQRAVASCLVQCAILHTGVPQRHPGVTFVTIHLAILAVGEVDAAVVACDRAVTAPKRGGTLMRQCPLNFNCCF